MSYDDIFDRSEARILIDDLIRGDTTITLELIRNKIIDLEKGLFHSQTQIYKRILKDNKQLEKDNLQLMEDVESYKNQLMY